ncbi:MAG: hypothetical protein M3O86_06040 [Actinomycetota bacterium]|nr:hypothetical protein [Actinomycetota bacterium]
MNEHPEQADRIERELDDMQHESEQLEGRIDETRTDWERKKADASVPGALGDPQAAEGDLPPEANYTSRGD